MAAQGLDGFLVPHEDEHQNEYLPAANDRLAWADRLHRLGRRRR